MVISVAFVAIRAADRAGVDAVHGAVLAAGGDAMLPRMRKASPPNIFFSVSAGSLPVSWRIRPASSSPKVIAAIEQTVQRATANPCVVHH
jgi:hypothetical protein